MSSTPRVRTAAVVSIGDELTTGQSLDTNSRWLASYLLERGVTPVEHVTVPDDTPIITDTFRRLADAADVIVTTGGLGPTADDLTRDSLASVMREQLVTDEPTLAAITERFSVLGRTVSDAQRVQALRPTSARCLRNDNGTAPALVGRFENGRGAPVTVWCFPGPPREMRPIVERELGPWLNQHAASKVTLVKLHACGLGESDAAVRLGDILDRNNEPVVGITASKGVVTLRIRRTVETGIDMPGGSPPNTPDPLLERTIEACRDRLGEFIFAQGETTLPMALAQMLRERGRKLVVVESCTGGMLGAMLTDPPGASDVFLGGWLTYANDMKHRLVGVPADILKNPGAVSCEVARSMALGALEQAPAADDALAITGIAGPGGATDGKPVGTVWIALASRPAEGGADVQVDARCFRITGDRADVRERSALTAINMLRLRLQTGTAPGPLLWQVDPPPMPR